MGICVWGVFALLSCRVCYGFGGVERALGVEGWNRGVLGTMSRSNFEWRAFGCVIMVLGLSSHFIREHLVIAAGMRPVEAFAPSKRVSQSWLWNQCLQSCFYEIGLSIPFLRPHA